MDHSSPVERLQRIARQQGGYLTRQDGKDCGYLPSELGRLVDRGVLVRLRRGAFAVADDHATWSRRQRHLVTARAALAHLGPGYALSHDSAAAAHDLSLYGLDLDVVHVARVGGTTSRTRNGITRHRDVLEEADVVDVDGLRVVRAPLAVAQAAVASDVERGAVLVSSWISHLRSDARRRGRLEQFSQEEAKGDIRRVLASYAGRPGTRTAADAVTIADGRCESPGEVRVLVLCWRFDLPRPEMQYELSLLDGRRAEVDFLWPTQRLVVEFDGRVKYDEDGDESARATVWAEKRRELKVRDLGYHVVRLTWADLAPENAERTAARLRRELARAQRLYGHLSVGSSGAS